MLNAEKHKKRFYIFLVFYFLFGIALLLILDRAVSPDFEQKYLNTDIMVLYFCVKSELTTSSSKKMIIGPNKKTWNTTNM